MDTGGQGGLDAEAAPRVVSADELTAMAESALAHMGAPPDTARAVAASLVGANLVGHDSHGVRRLPVYARAVRLGRIDPAARPEVTGRDGAVVTVRGHRAFGQIAAAAAVEALEEAVRSHGIGVAAVRECNHIGRLGEYVEAMARAGHIGIALCNVDPTVAPFGGRERRLGTNPLAWALPCGPAAPGDPGGGEPVVMDWATSAIAEGKLAMLRARGEPAPDGVLLDPAGRVSTEPGDFYGGGALLPFAGHKGYGLSVMIEAVGGLLSGGGISCLPDYDGGNGTVLMGVDPARFLPPAVFRAQVEDFTDELRRTPAAQGHTEVLVPGDVERRARAERTAAGIPVPAATWNDLLDLLPPGGADARGADRAAGTGGGGDGGARPSPPEEPRPHN
ncbi:Ldh family oxidoreductase [Streptomonospora sp. S1-112]|uniref:Ldh family oxidoreductase n=1 Tax=Streptomonospora mangrovi TaxID=2883123 RepID=A0A9X3NII7_9ACTN|nr:Ldh family oxidoreductase [Streptomonospora mangrovi]MDA0563695.1 Ldh family oxidoreductase [Streptomonospora mangrovi]